MFSPKWTESGSTEFRVGHISFDVLSVIIKYLYTGVIKVTGESIFFVFTSSIASIFIVVSFIIKRYFGCNDGFRAVFN